MDGHQLKSTLLFLLMTTTTISAVKERCHPDDKKALLSMKQTLNKNALPGWSPDTDCCKIWYGIRCDFITNRVISLYITNDMDLVGTISPAIGDLPYLQDLTMRKLPNVTGTIPSSITKLQHLVYAIFNSNQLSGPIPSFFHRMNSLSTLVLSFNRFSGSIPPELTLAPSLLRVDFSRNLLTGSIPDFFGHFKIARNTSDTFGTFFLGLSHNQLSGPIPRSLGNVNFSQIDLSRNQLTGDASFLFGKDKPLTLVDLSRNQLSFDFSTLEMPMSVSVDLNHNRIYGSFPSTGMENVEFLNVSYNRLCGPIPNVGKLPTFDQTNYFHNKCLCGPPLPACIS